MTGTRWRHVKRGTTYVVIGMAQLQTSCTAGQLVDMEAMVIYQSEFNGTKWVRSLIEFTDGRFERLYPEGHHMHVPS